MADGTPAGSTATSDEATRPPSAPVEPRVLAGRLRLAMIRLTRQLRRQDPSELSLAQLSVLATVVGSGPLGVGQLADLEGLPSPAVTRLADKLEEAGLAARRANPADRRGVLVVATAAGADLLAQRAEVGTAWLAGRLAALSEADRMGLERVVTLLEALAAERLGHAPDPAVAAVDRGEATGVSV